MKRLSIRIKEKKTGVFQPFRVAIIFCVAALLLTLSPHAIEAQAAPSGALDFEIPMNELNRDTNVAPVKRAVRTPEKKKKSAAKARRSRTAAKSSRTAPKKVASIAAPQQASLTTSEALQPFRIFNVPYSFVVTGKSTVIKAVIYREADDLQSVNCTVRVAATGALSVVKMAKVDGFRFTYAATLPEVAADAASLRYTIIATDSSGTESGSPEFATPVTFSPLVPGWQF